MSTRTMRSALLLLLAAGLLGAGCSKSSSSNPMAPPVPVNGGGTTLQVLGMNGANSFSPNPGSVTAGMTVAWHNNDVITHTATADNGSFDTGPIAPGTTSAPITMSTAGTFGYHCSIHPTMTGTLNVGMGSAGGGGGGMGTAY